MVAKLLETFSAEKIKLVFEVSNTILPEIYSSIIE